MVKCETKADFSARVLLALVSDLAAAKEAQERIAVQIVALAREHGVSLSESI